MEKFFDKEGLIDTAHNVHKRLIKQQNQNINPHKDRDTKQSGSQTSDDQCLEHWISENGTVASISETIE